MEFVSEWWGRGARTGGGNRRGIANGSRVDARRWHRAPVLAHRLRERQHPRVRLRQARRPLEEPLRFAPSPGARVFRRLRRQRGSARCARAYSAGASAPPVVLLPGPTDSWVSYELVLDRLPPALRAIAGCSSLDPAGSCTGWGTVSGRACSIRRRRGQRRPRSPLSRVPRCWRARPERRHRERRPAARCGGDARIRPRSCFACSAAMRSR